MLLNYVVESRLMYVFVVVLKDIEWSCPIIIRRDMIFVQPFWDNLIFLFFWNKKNRERK